MFEDRIEALEKLEEKRNEVFALRRELREAYELLAKRNEEIRFLRSSLNHTVF